MRKRWAVPAYNPPFAVRLPKELREIVIALAQERDTNRSQVLIDLVRRGSQTITTPALAEAWAVSRRAKWRPQDGGAA